MAAGPVFLEATATMAASAPMLAGTRRAEGGSGCIIANAKVPMAASEPVRAARPGSFSHLIEKPRANGGNATAEYKVLKKCEACQADLADPYHFLIECTEARCLAARVTNYALTRGIAEAVARHAVGIAD